MDASFVGKGSYFTVTSTVEKRALLLVREMDSFCGAATPAHPSSTIAEAHKQHSAHFLLLSVPLNAVLAR